ncbi:acetyl-CoA carboxylase biotin carboxylase subunit [Antricoccus suffuscus]|uniref:Acetyl-CoA carboxylase biotin carboxylase subunit n=1 Tax=Antricoccus suffuscus TaxID=1629062 RepID=A0A2T0ZX08_9ACTN|nr:biotin carboxylase N-terminal domain-containing protein [Antricoccus suffuscus]PRZ40880.1 acetyl-CoA carboxylase biotin carboxylase subunit [Antricoccus suffuscus]
MNLPTRLIVADRGEIACRIFESCRKLGIGTVAVYSAAEAESKHVRMADIAICVGSADPGDSYMNRQRVLAAAIDSGADAVHPGYGFLSEDPQFARDVIRSGLTWVGPSPDVIETLRDRIRARALMEAAGVRAVPGRKLPSGDSSARAPDCGDIGYPLVVKAGRGPRGTKIARSARDLDFALVAARADRSRMSTSDPIIAEKYFEHARHIEVQIVGLRSGHTVALGERDCSVQRQHQKVLGETPAPRLEDTQRDWLYETAVRVARAVDYRGIGTVEFILNVESREFYFLEMNTRLQVEHPITEMVTGLDLVHEQLLLASGEPPSVGVLVPTRPSGHSMEFRIYAEEPIYLGPRPERIREWIEPAAGGIRVDSGYEAGDAVTADYDQLLAKIVVWGRDRAEAMFQLLSAARQFRIGGLGHNLPLVTEILGTDDFYTGNYDTSLLTQIQQ